MRQPLALELQTQASMWLPEACPVCHRLSWSEVGLCEHCGPKLLPHYAPIVRDLGGFYVRSLFRWGTQSPRALSDLIYSLKGREDAAAWRRFALALHESFPDDRDRVFIPIPGKGRNHALGLARALGEIVDQPVDNSLKFARRSWWPTAQKTRTRAERAAICFDLDRTGAKRRGRRIVLVDDVITTGATARAAHHALGRPSRFEVWCLMDRRPCGR